VKTRKSITIYGIAKEAGVSPSTVSRVLTGKARVDETKRKRIEEVIRRHHYRPSALARGLSTRESRVIGFIMPDVSHPYYGATFLGAENRAVELGYSLILGNTLNDNIGHVTHVETRLLDIMLDKQVDGIILTGGRVQETNPIPEHLEQIRRIAERVPVVTLSGRMKGATCHSVEIDDARGVELALNYLVTLRHLSIGFLGGIGGIEPTDTRRAAFRACLESHGLEYVPEWCREGGFGIEEGRAGMEAFLSMKRRPSAIVAFNDLNAIGAMYTARKNGLRIPEDLSIVGIDNIPLTEYLVPRITSVDIRAREQGGIAVDVMVEVLRSGKPERRTVLDPRLVIRDSCIGPAGGMRPV
jgi:DNA-binding LacI/PurR family transcriptional regulator